MTQSDLEAVISQTKHERYRWLTSDDNPDVAKREGYRRIVREMASGTPKEYPPVATQIGNALGAAVRFAASGFQVVDQAEFDRRRAVCLGCSSFDADQDRCRSCGCALAVKPWSKAERCPLGRWEEGDAALERGGRPVLVDDGAGAV